MAANKVFIVEDDAVIARAVAAHLTTWQMQVQCAGNFEKITEEVGKNNGRSGRFSTGHYYHGYQTSVL